MAKHSDRLTAPQRAAITAAARGPLFRAGRRWARSGAGAFTDASIDRLLDLRIMERAVTRHGVPMVRLTETGRAIVDDRLSGARRRVEREAEARALHERIAP